MEYRCCDMAKNPTMNDVACEANVALKTVSRFVNGETNINPQMNERIFAAIQKLGYRRNLAAASIRPGQTTKVLGLIIGDISNPFYSALTAAVEREARKRGYLLISASSEESGETHDRLVSRLLAQQVEGLIVVPPRVPGAAWAELDPSGVPLVFVDRPAAAQNSDVVLADNYGGAKLATSRLIAEGAHRIVFLGDKLDIFTMSERLGGYSDAFSQAGLTIDADLVRSTIHSVDDAALELSRLLDEVPHIQGIFAANNRATMGSLIAFNTVRRRVALIGFDDFEAARLGEPPVSVVVQDVSKMGRRAVECLLSRIETDDLAPRRIILTTELVLRGSERL